MRFTGGATDLLVRDKTKLSSTTQQRKSTGLNNSDQQSMGSTSTSPVLSSPASVTHLQDIPPRPNSVNSFVIDSFGGRSAHFGDSSDDRDIDQLNHHHIFPHPFRAGSAHEILNEMAFESLSPILAQQSSNEYEYGPGFVDKLKSKFLSISSQTANGRTIVVGRERAESGNHHNGRFIRSIHCGKTSNCIINRMNSRNSAMKRFASVESLLTGNGKATSDSSDFDDTNSNDTDNSTTSSTATKPPMSDEVSNNKKARGEPTMTTIECQEVIDSSSRPVPTPRLKRQTPIVTRPANCDRLLRAKHSISDSSVKYGGGNHHHNHHNNNNNMNGNVSNGSISGGGGDKKMMVDCNVTNGSVKISPITRSSVTISQNNHIVNGKATQQQELPLPTIIPTNQQQNQNQNQQQQVNQHNTEQSPTTATPVVALVAQPDPAATGKPESRIISDRKLNGSTGVVQQQQQNTNQSLTTTKTRLYTPNSANGASKNRFNTSSATSAYHRSSSTPAVSQTHLPVNHHQLNRHSAPTLPTISNNPPTTTFNAIDESLLTTNINNNLNNNNSNTNHQLVSNITSNHADSNNETATTTGPTITKPTIVNGLSIMKRAKLIKSISNNSDASPAPTTPAAALVAASAVTGSLLIMNAGSHNNKSKLSESQQHQQSNTTTTKDKSSSYSAGRTPPNGIILKPKDISPRIISTVASLFERKSASLLPPKKVTPPHKVIIPPITPNNDAATHYINDTVKSESDVLRSTITRDVITQSNNVNNFISCASSQPVDTSSSSSSLLSSSSDASSISTTITCEPAVAVQSVSEPSVGLPPPPPPPTEPSPSRLSTHSVSSSTSTSAQLLINSTPTPPLSPNYHPATALTTTSTTTNHWDISEPSNDSHSLIANDLLAAIKGEPAAPAAVTSLTTSHKSHSLQVTSTSAQEIANSATSRLNPTATHSHSINSSPSSPKELNESVKVDAVVDDLPKVDIVKNVKRIFESGKSQTKGVGGVGGVSINATLHSSTYSSPKLSTTSSVTTPAIPSSMTPTTTSSSVVPLKPYISPKPSSLLSKNSNNKVLHQSPVTELSTRSSSPKIFNSDKPSKPQPPPINRASRPSLSTKPNSIAQPVVTRPAPPLVTLSTIELKPTPTTISSETKSSSEPPKQPPPPLPLHFQNEVSKVILKPVNPPPPSQSVVSHVTATEPTGPPKPASPIPSATPLVATSSSSTPRDPTPKVVSSLASLSATLSASSNSMVFDFRGRQDVKAHVALQPMVFGGYVTPSYEMEDEDENESKDDIDSDATDSINSSSYQTGGNNCQAIDLPLPLVVEFVGANVVISGGMLLKKRSKNVSL